MRGNKELYQIQKTFDDLIHISAETPTRFAAAYAERVGRLVSSFSELPGAGSSRRYFRMGFENGESVIVAWGKDSDENRSFITLSALFRRYGLPVPKVYAVSSPYIHMYILEDLGDDALFSFISTREGREVACDAMTLLPCFQLIKEAEWDFLVFNSPFFGREILGDLHYFKYCFLKPSGVEFNERLLEMEFRDIVSMIDDIPKKYRGLVLRDFQSRNVMVKKGQPYFIDFQGARFGPMAYDAVSFLWQAKAGFDAYSRRVLLEVYKNALEDEIGQSAARVLKDIPVLALLRIIQTLGAYGFRGLIEHKSHFITSIPAALANLRQLLDDPEEAGCPCGWKMKAADRWPELCRVAEELCGLKKFQPLKAGEGLTVTVTRFSYKNGYPEDMTGNGGGFVFDCRALPNPGRYDRYRTQTGLDVPVRLFLDKEEEVEEFMENALRMVLPSVERYVERGFSSLQVACGCTGGRHRSVYTADHIARRIKEKFPQVNVRIIHREHDLEETL